MVRPPHFDEEPFPNLSDTKLVHILRNGNSIEEKEKAGNSIVEKHHDPLMRYAVERCSGETFHASDMVTTAFYQAIQYLLDTDSDDIDLSLLLLSKLQKQCS